MFNRINFLGWYLLTVLFLYLVFNPWGFSLVEGWSTAWALDTGRPQFWLKVLATLAAAVIAFGLVRTTFKTLGFIGIIAYVAAIAILLVLLNTLGVFAVVAGTVAYWFHWPLALLLVLGLRWPKIWGAISGQRTVTSGADDDGLDDGHGHDGHGH